MTALVDFLVYDYHGRDHASLICNAWFWSRGVLGFDGGVFGQRRAFLFVHFAYKTHTVITKRALILPSHRFNAC